MEPRDAAGWNQLPAVCEGAGRGHGARACHRGRQHPRLAQDQQSGLPFQRLCANSCLLGSGSALSTLDVQDVAGATAGTGTLLSSRRRAQLTVDSAIAGAATGAYRGTTLVDGAGTGAAGTVGPAATVARHRSQAWPSFGYGQYDVHWIEGRFDDHVCRIGLVPGAA